MRPGATAAFVVRFRYLSFV